MGFSEAVQFYYPLFGLKGVCMAALARLKNKYPLVPMTVDGIAAPVYVRWRTSDLAVFRQVFVLGEYDCEVPHQPDVIIDAGANIGLTAILYANKYPSAKIIALEPEPSNFEMLLKNVEVYPQVTALKAALWAENANVSLFDPGLGHYGFRTVSTPDLAETLGRVEAFSVAGLMNKFRLKRIDLLKMDIEGAEEDVFENCRAWIDRVDAVIAETHDRFRPCSSAVVLAALVDFDLRWQVGETLYFGRSALASPGFRPGAVSCAYRGHHIASFKRSAGN